MNGGKMDRMDRGSSGGGGGGKRDVKEQQGRKETNTQPDATSSGPCDRAGALALLRALGHGDQD